MSDFWAKRGRKQVGPFPTRDEAVTEFRKAFPFKGPEYAHSTNKNKILSGYGAGGIYFDLRWHNALHEEI
jgi:hypothetical protein